jgi:hypothetical protein
MMFSELEGGEKENHPLKGGTTTVLKRLVLNTYRKAIKNWVLLLLVGVVSLTLFTILSASPSSPNSSTSSPTKKTSGNINADLYASKQNDLLLQKERDFQSKLEELAEKERQLTLMQQRFSQQQEVIENQQKQLEDLNKLKASLSDRQKELDNLRKESQEQSYVVVPGEGQAGGEGRADPEKRDRVKQVSNRS